MTDGRTRIRTAVQSGIL